MRPLHFFAVGLVSLLSLSSLAADLTQSAAPPSGQTLPAERLPATGYNGRYVGGGVRSHDALGPFTVTVDQPQHAIMTGVPATFEVQDELYQTTLDPAAGCQVLATTSTSKKTNQTHPSVWV